MPQIPTAIDYGGRPSLQTNRVDRPSGGSVRTADALVAAASEFKQVLDQKKAKEDRLNYALARNEIQQADLETRASLAEDQDWATHDERYSTGFNTARDEILGRYPSLSPNDKAMIGSESNLIHAQGRVSVGEGARRLEIDEKRARYEIGKAKARASLIGLDQASRNNVVLGQLEIIDSLVESGILSDEQGQAERESMTQDFALSSIEAMPVEERIRVLEKSLRYRKGYGASLGPHSGDILSAAEETGLSPELIAAVASRESGHDPSAVSGAGATGVMQLMEDAAAEMGVTDRTDPTQSIHGGAAYLAKKYAQFDGDPEAALAAYNWGSGNVRKAQAKDPDNWLSLAPKETQDYVAALAPIWTQGGGGKEIQTKGKYATGEGPLDADAIRNGEGTGSIADFLHADTAAKMLDQAYKGDKANQDRKAAYAVVDVAKNLFKEDEEAMMKYIRANTSGSVRAIAESEGQQLIAETARAKEAVEVAFVNDMGKQIRDGDLSLEDVKATDEYHKLGLIRQESLAEIDRQRLHDEQYARQTQWKAREGDGGYSVEGFESLPKYGHPPLLTQSNVDLTDASWSAVLDQQASNTLMGIQTALGVAENMPTTNLGKTPKQMVADTLAATGWQGASLTDKEKIGVKARLELALTARIATKQNTFTPPRELYPEEANYELNQLMQQTAEIDVFWGTSESVKVATMAPDQLEEAFLPIADARRNTTSDGITIEEFLIQKGRDKQEKGGAGITGKISEEDIQRAYFALESGLGMAAVLSRLKGE